MKMLLHVKVLTRALNFTISNSLYSLITNGYFPRDDKIINFIP